MALLARFGISMDHLPGDISWRHKNVTVYLPMGICIVVSVVLTLVLYLLARFRQ